MPRAKLVFDSGGIWKLYRNSSGYCFQLRSDFLGEMPYKQAIVSPDFTKVRIDLLQRHFDPSKAWNPLEYPLDELLWIHRLAMGQGVEMHGCGVITPDGRGFLLTGHSGAGKSTSARLWSAQIWRARAQRRSHHLARGRWTHLDVWHAVARRRWHRGSGSLRAGRNFCAGAWRGKCFCAAASDESFC